MANSKISALTSATTPVAGTEVLPIVQSSATKQLSIANLTVGRAVTGASFNASAAAGAILSSTATNAAAASYYQITANDVSSVTRTYYFGQNISANLGALEVYSASLPGTVLSVAASSSDVKFNVGNLIQGTAAKGINFTANTPQAGMTSQLLNWYEEGTWTPNQGGGLTVVGAFSSAGKYTRIGREVTIIASVSGATSVSILATSAICTNLPFVSSTTALGTIINNSVTVSGATYVTSSTISSGPAIGATPTLFFQVTYFI